MVMLVSVPLPLTRSSILIGGKGNTDRSGDKLGGRLAKLLTTTTVWLVAELIGILELVG